MLADCSPTVVHITTSPQAHFDVARECLEAGCNVYVEKPFTVNAAQAVELVRLAETRSLKLTAGHNTQFSPVARAMRELIAAGYTPGAAFKTMLRAVEDAQLEGAITTTAEGLTLLRNRFPLAG